MKLINLTSIAIIASLALLTESVPIPATAEQKAAKEAFKQQAAEAKRQAALAKHSGKNDRTEVREERTEVRGLRAGVRMERVEVREDRADVREDRHQEKIDHSVNHQLTQKEIARARLANMADKAA